jgi:RHS repeat-associated protein
VASISCPYTDGFDQLICRRRLTDGALPVSEYAYDAAGNMTMNTGLCAGANRLVYPAQGAGSGHPHAPSSICGSPVAYDANGNTLAYDGNGPLPGHDRSFAYDGENRPAAISLGGSVAAAFLYGPDGERLRKTTAAGARTVWSLGADTELAVVLTTNQTVWTRYPAGDVKIEGATVSFQHRDHLGSRQRASFMGSGMAPDAVDTWHVYAAYGQLVAGTPIDGRAYLGEVHDPETGLQYLHARYYDALLGRFLSPDPLDPNKLLEAIRGGLSVKGPGSGPGGPGYSN